MGSFKNTLLILLAILTVSGLSIVDVKGSSDVTTISVSPLLTFASVGEHFSISIEIRDAIDVYAWQVNLTFDSNVVEFVNATLPLDHFLEGRPEGTTGILIAEYTDSVLLGCVIMGDYDGIHGSGTLVTVEFEVVGIGGSALRFDVNWYDTPIGPVYRTYLIDSHLQETHPGPYLRLLDGYFTSEDNWIELFELAHLYDQLLVNYSSLLASYYSLNSSYYSLLDDYQDLLNSYDELESDYVSLNTTYTSLLDDHSQLQTDYDSLQSEYDNLSDNYNSLETLYQLLNSTYNSLKADYDDLKSKYETNTYELGSARSLSYILIITTAAFIVTTAYFALRKPKVKTT